MFIVVVYLSPAFNLLIYDEEALKLNVIKNMRNMETFLRKGFILLSNNFMLWLSHGTLMSKAMVAFVVAVVQP